MINREQYMEQIVPFIDKPFVKVITGIPSACSSEVQMLSDYVPTRENLFGTFVARLVGRAGVGEWICIFEAIPQRDY